MAHIYEPEIESDDGYSIPKILVAVLLLVLIGAGAYIYFQQKKLKTSVSYLLDSKKSVEQDLNQMIEKYNLAIDDNGSLETELKDERDFIIRYRDSIRNIKSEDLKNVASLKNTVLKLQETSAVQFANASASSIQNSSPTEVTIDEGTSENQDAASQSKSDNLKESNEIKPGDISEISEASDSIINTDKTTIVMDSISNQPNPENKIASQNTKKETEATFNRVEIPPTYPGCGGTVNERKVCFSKKVKKHLSRRFDASIIENLNIESGQKRVWVHFYIDKNGNVTNVKARGPHEKLEQEATRVIKSLPKMTPAKQNGKSVKISYSVPITIKAP